MTKSEKIRSLVRRKRGASLAEIARATGWKRHSVAGALSRLRSGGLPIVAFEDERRGRVYRANDAA